MAVRILARTRPLAALGLLFTVAASAPAQTPVALFQADRLAGANGAAVSVWPDASGQHNDAKAPAPAQSPSLALAAMNGHKAVHFTSETKTELALPRPIQDDWTIVCVFQSTHGLGGGRAWYDGAGLVDGEVEHVHYDLGLSLSSSGQLMAGVGHRTDWDDTYISSDPGFNDGKPHVVTLERIKSSGAITLYVDSDQADTAVGTTGSLVDPPRLTLGAIQTDVNYLTGDIAEVQIYATALSDSERQTTESALKSKYGIPTPPPESPPSTVPATDRLSPVVLPPNDKPAIHGPRVVGASPLHPFLFLIPATGAEPLTYTCADLPSGLVLDAKTGVISGVVRLAGTSTLHLSVSNAQGTDTRALTVVCGDHPLALTPPMGWDATNVYANQIDDAKARDTADRLISTGLAAHGYSYLHIGDTWQGIRNKKTGEILPNRRRFPDLKDLGDYLHGKGLKFGLYTSVTEHTCAGYPGSLGYYDQDAASYASWGVDYLEASWCPVATMDEAKVPDEKTAFRQMSDALRKTNRDVVYAINTFGNDYPWDFGPNVGANSWVTSHQLYDEWSLVVDVTFNQVWMADRARPGQWNSPGLLQIGKFGADGIHKTRLSYPEQMSQFSQTCLLSAPLWVSADLSSLDPNTLHPSTTALLTNDEVLDVDQDPAGHGPTQVYARDTMKIWSKVLSDGTVAVGLFNLADTAQTLKVRWGQIGLSGSQPVRDLWLHQDLGTFTGAFATAVPSHGVALVRIGTPSAPKP